MITQTVIANEQLVSTFKSEWPEFKLPQELVYAEFDIGPDRVLNVRTYERENGEWLKPLDYRKFNNPGLCALMHEAMRMDLEEKAKQSH